MRECYIDIKKELPLVDKRVKVRPWIESVWLSKYDFLHFDPLKEYYGKLIIVFNAGGFEPVWKIEGFDQYHKMTDCSFSRFWNCFN